MRTLLSRKQYELLAFIHECIRKNGVPPTFDEMKGALDPESESRVLQRLIKKLEARGLLLQTGNRTRATFAPIASPANSNKPSKPKTRRSGLPVKAPFMQSFFDANDRIVLERIAESFGMSKNQVAATAGIERSALRKTERRNIQNIQNRMREMLEIVGRVAAWTGGAIQAMAWYRSEPIPAFGGRTAESLVKDGKAASVRDYLDSIAMGGFA